MEFGTSLPLDGSGQPKLLEDEVQYRLQSAIDVYDRDTKTDRRKGALAVTSHRVYWTDEWRRTAIQWHLHQVVKLDHEDAGMLFGSAKIVIFVSTSRVAGPSSENGGAGYPSLAPASAAASAHVKFSFKDGGKDPVFDALKLALSRRSWEKAVATPRTLGSLGTPAATPTSGSATPGATSPGGATPRDGLPQEVRRAGLSGVMEQRAARIAESRALTDSAFSDLDALAKHASSIVAMAEGYAAELKRQKQREKEKEAASAAAAASDGGTGATTGESGAGASSGSGGGGLDDDTLGSLVGSLGIVAPLATPVTKEMAGSLYIQEMARQVASFLR
jgi:hypothetical protein